MVTVLGLEVRLWRTGLGYTYAGSGTGRCGGGLEGAAGEVLGVLTFFVLFVLSGMYIICR